MNVTAKSTATYHPPGALEVAQKTGGDPEKLLVFHSLSKRSNLPGLRSGFVAGGANNIARIKRLRNFSGAPVPLPLQKVSEKIWADDAHVAENRELYREKFTIADQVFENIDGCSAPDAGFFLWLPVDNGEQTALKLWQETGIRALPGAYLSRKISGEDPGEKYLRVALVAPKNEVQRGLTKLRDCIYG